MRLFPAELRQYQMLSAQKLWPGFALRENRTVTAGLVGEKPYTSDHEVPISVARIPGLTDLWAKTRGDFRVTIAVLDGPVDCSHPALARAELKLTESLAPTAVVANGLATIHGTQVASLIFGQHDPGSSVLGVAPRCRGVVIPIYHDSRRGSSHDLACSQLDLAHAILLAADQGADVINVSGGELAPSGAAHPVLADAIRHCVRHGILIVAAAGNEGCNCLHIPAAVPGVLAVGAMASDGHPLPSSNWGNHYRRTGLLAPGVSLCTAVPNTGVTAASGTSFAAAIVSGAVGLLLSLARIQRLGYNGQQIGQFLLDTAHTCPDDSLQCRQTLAGRLDIPRASLLLSMKVSSMSNEFSPGELSTESHDGETKPVLTQTALPISAGGVAPAAGCGCESCRAKATDEAESSPARTLVFALGQLDLDLVTEAREQSLQQHLWEFRHRKHQIPYDSSRLPTAVEANPRDPSQLLEYLEDEENCWDATAVYFILRLHQTPIYTVLPAGPFAQKTYKFLIKTLREQLAQKDQERVEWVSIPGRIAGQVRLQSGQVVPAIVPEPRGIYSWNLLCLAEQVAGVNGSAKAEHVGECLDRIYYSLSNLGRTSRDRALNYAATNAAQLGNIFEKVLTYKEPMALDEIEAEPSASAHRGQIAGMFPCRSSIPSEQLRAYARYSASRST